MFLQDHGYSSLASYFLSFVIYNNTLFLARMCKGEVLSLISLAPLKKCLFACVSVEYVESQ